MLVRSPFRSVILVRLVAPGQDSTAFLGQVKGLCQQYSVAAISQNFAAVTVTTFCMPEILALTDATMWIAGVPWEKLAGDGSVAWL